MKNVICVLLVCLMSQFAFAGDVMCGIDVLKRDGFAPLKGKKIALITNHTGRDREGNTTVDLLTKADGVKVVRLFSPEHGLYGKLDEKVGNVTDEKTGLKVYSLYGETRKPTDEMLEGIDTLVYDIQDVGARFYTYSATMGLCMEAAARKKLAMFVLDRPNPITGKIVEGPIADEKHLGFTAFRPIPVSHGMTFGELAQMFNEHFKVGCDLHVVKIEGWTRDMWFDATGLTWVNPSPNMRNLNQALLYPGVCLIEATNVSVGRGTDQPFETLGAPWINGRQLAAALNGENLPGVRFVPIEFTPTSSKFKGELCQGVNVLIVDREKVQPVGAGIAIAWHLNHLFGEKFEFAKLERLLQNDKAVEAVKNASKPSEVPANWTAELEEFNKAREKYLIYR
jgi:uncharacterized protein YbbC (DUF1343 family)